MELLCNLNSVDVKIAVAGGPVRPIRITGLGN